MFSAQLFTTLLAFLAVGVQASPLFPRDVISPRITNPKPGSVWPIGTVQTVTWYMGYNISSGLGVKPCTRDTSNFPPDSLNLNLIGQVILGFNESDSLHLDLGTLSSFMIHWHRTLLQPSILNEWPVYTLELATAMLHRLLPYPVKLCITSLYNDEFPGLHFARIRCSLTQPLCQNTHWHRTSISQMEVPRSRCQTSHLGPTILSSVSLFPRCF